MNPQMIVIPKSKKAKNRLCNLMNSDPVVTIEQETQDQFFCVSSNKQNCFWVNKQSDNDWTMLPISL